MPEHPHQKHEFTDQEQHALVQLRTMMGGESDEDKEVEEHLQRIQEANAAKMHAAQTGGAATGLGPTEAEAALIKQQAALGQQAAGQSAQAAAQAQVAKAPIQAPAAPSGPQGVTQPYKVQAGLNEGPEADQEPPAAPIDSNEERS
jgi:hypothetical protein